MKRCSFGIPTVFDLPLPCPFVPYFPTVYVEQSLFAIASDLFPLFYLSSPAGRVDAPDTADWGSAEPVSGSDINAYTGRLCVRLSAVAAR